MKYENEPISAVFAGVSSGAPVAAMKIKAGSAVKIFPTSPGSATVYSSFSHDKDIRADLAAGNSAIVGSLNANWDVWGAGTVGGETIQQVLLPVKAIALVVLSGIWTLEVCS